MFWSKREEEETPQVQQVYLDQLDLERVDPCKGHSDEVELATGVNYGSGRYGKVTSTISTQFGH